jgi:hypothetical protein
MTRTALYLTLAAAFAATPLLAQGNMGGMRGMGDPTTKVAGSGKLPDGWMLRFDTPRGGGAMPAPTEVNFRTMGTGYHVTSGPPAIYYSSKDQGSGQYAFSATFHQAKSMVHEAYGIFIGGSNLQDSTQNYLYLVIRPLDGAFAIEHRAGNVNPTKLAVMTPNDAVVKDGADGSATNTLTIHVAADTVHFLVNGKLVKAIAKSDLNGAATSGQAGLRINHNIDIHVDNVGIKK